VNPTGEQAREAERKNAEKQAIRQGLTIEKSVQMKNSQTLALSSIITALLVFGFVAQANAAQIDASLIPEYDKAAGIFTGTKFVHIRYEQGSAISKMFNGKTERIEFSIEGTNSSGISGLVAAVNQALLDVNSTVHVKNANVSYSGVLKGGPDMMTLTYNVEMHPAFSGFKLEQNSEGKILMDINWRGFTIDGPVLVDSPEHGKVDINQPIGLLEVADPEFASKLMNAEVRRIMTQPILDFQEIGDASMERWHTLFDPTFNQASTKGVIKSDDIGRAKVLSVYSLGECSIREGCPLAKEDDASVAVDNTPLQVHISTPQPNSHIEIAGFTSIQKAGKDEIIVASMDPGVVLPSFTIQVLMVLGGMMAAIALFVLVKARK
jgi:hypothetical protein